MYRNALTLTAVAALLAAPAGAHAYTHAPFFEHPVELGQVYGLERMGVRMGALLAFDEPPDDLVEEAEKMLARDLPLFMGSLGTTDPETASALAAAVDELLMTASVGGELEAPAAAVAQLAATARAALVPDDLVQSAPFRAALLTKLVLADDGVAEAYEDAAEGDEWEYPAGWSALQRVKVLWEDLRPLADETAAFEIDDMLAELDALLPQAAPPERFVGDPEEPEAYAHRLIGFVEQVADADLYPSRDLGRAAGLVIDLATAGCDAYGAGEAGLGRERASLAQFHYAEVLRRPLGMLAADEHGIATDAFAVLRGKPDEAAAAAACDDLLPALEKGTAVFPPSPAR